MKRFLVIAFIFLLFSFILIVVIFGSVLSLQEESSPELSGLAGSFILEIPDNSQVYKYMGLMEKEIIEQGLSTYYLPVLLAIMEQESGGNAEATRGDIMQASESIDGKIGNITTVDHSIKQGVKYFKGLLDTAEAKGVNDLNIVIQAYNYGSGFIDFSLSYGKVFSEQMAFDFREKMRVEYSWEGYGDPNYVSNVTRYLSPFRGEKRGALFFPVAGKPYCSYGFGYRQHPLYLTDDFHNGMDFLGEEGTPLYSAMPGQVEVINNSSMGLCVLIKYDDLAIYNMHMSYTNLKTGDYVREGELIGLMGNTGVSTTPHLHFQLEINGLAIDPAPYFHEDDYIRGF